jgi:hypothetical protein
LRLGLGLSGHERSPGKSSGRQRGEQRSGPSGRRIHDGKARIGHAGCAAGYDAVWQTEEPRACIRSRSQTCVCGQTRWPIPTGVSIHRAGNGAAPNIVLSLKEGATVVACRGGRARNRGVPGKSSCCRPCSACRR